MRDVLIKGKTVVQGDAEQLDLWREWNSTAGYINIGKRGERCSTLPGAHYNDFRLACVQSKTIETEPYVQGREAPFQLMDIYGLVKA